MDNKKSTVVFSPSNVPFAPGETIGVYKDANDRIWFHGPDVARLLGQRPADMYRMVDKENKVVHNVHGVNQECISLSEAGFYQIALASRTKLGKKLMKFVCEELLPSIRQNGTYISPTASPEQIKLAIENQIVQSARKLALGKKLKRNESIQAHCKQLFSLKGYLEIKNDSVSYIRDQLRSSPKGSQDYLFKALRAAANEHMAGRIAEGSMDMEKHFGAQLLLLEIADNKADYLNRSRAKRLVDANRK